MQTFKKEIKTILTHLAGSQWATHSEVHKVLKEYDHLTEASRTPTQTRRVSLQIFHACRAIDSFLAHLASHESSKPGKPGPPKYFTLGESLGYINANGVGGRNFTPVTNLELDELRKVRNLYLHAANVFPADSDIRRFLVRTVLALQEAATFTP
jgi:hypothetical protein